MIFRVLEFSCYCVASSLNSKEFCSFIRMNRKNKKEDRNENTNKENLDFLRFDEDYMDQFLNSNEYLSLRYPYFYQEFSKKVKVFFNYSCK